MLRALFRQSDDRASLVGLTIRGYRGAGDDDAIEQVLAACGRDTALDLPVSYAKNPNLDRDLLMVEFGGRMVGFGWVRWWLQPDGTWLYYHRGYLLPEVQGMGIGTRMLRHTEQRLREAAEWHLDFSRVYFGADVASNERAASRLLTTFGYTPQHTTVEIVLRGETRLPDAYLPGGFTLAPATPEEVWALKTATWKRQPDGTAFRAFVADADPSLWQVAWAGEQLVGIALGKLCGPVGMITDLVTRDEVAGTGLGRGLLLHAAHGLRVRGATEVRHMTASRSTVHETVGFRERETYTRYTKPFREEER